MKILNYIKIYGMENQPHRHKPLTTKCYYIRDFTPQQIKRLLNLYNEKKIKVTYNESESEIEIITRNKTIIALSDLFVHMCKHNIPFDDNDSNHSSTSNNSAKTNDSDLE